MSNLAYIEDLGIGGDQAVDDTEVEANDTIEESAEDLSLDSEETPSDNTESDTEQNSELDALKRQIEGMEKRIADKDEFINELRQQSKQKDEVQQEVDTPEEEDFWDNPEGKIGKLEEMLKQQQETMRVQQLQIQEGYYAQTVEDYWKTVNPDALKEAVATDTEFADKFNTSAEPYKTAYEYLKTKSETKKQSELSLREQIKQELMAEMGLTKEKKEVPPTVNGGSKSASTRPNVSEDGFAAVFGSAY